MTAVRTGRGNGDRAKSRSTAVSLAEIAAHHVRQDEEDMAIAAPMSMMSSCPLALLTA